MCVFAVSLSSYLLTNRKYHPTFVSEPHLLVSHNHRLGMNLVKLNKSILGESIGYINFTVIFL